MTSLSIHPWFFLTLAESIVIARSMITALMVAVMCSVTQAAVHRVTYQCLWLASAGETFAARHARSHLAATSLVKESVVRYSIAWHITANNSVTQGSARNATWMCK
jgi:hypothetical protein